MLVSLLYLLAAWAGSSIPRNGDWQQAGAGDPASVTIMVETNGVHTGIVMPVVHPQKDWRTTFPSAARPRDDGQMPTHIAVGWGEREVFLDVPTWGDLHPITALRIVTVGGESIVRVSHYARPAPGPNHRPMRISGAEYAVLVREIEASMPPPPDLAPRAELAGTEPRAAYYEALGRYTMRRNCNSWISDVLARAGIRTGWWTPLAGGVMKWVDPPSPL